jgi:zinc/manganese transport system ATP-binding protein
MTDSPDGAPRLRSASEIATRAWTTVRPVLHGLATGSRAVGKQANAVLSRYFDAGYHGDTSNPAAASAEAGIAVDNLSVAYGRRLAVEAFGGQFAPASLTAVVGPNGGGKSSLLKALAGVIRPRSGKIQCPALSTHRLAFLPQISELDRSFPATVAELVALGAWRSFGSFRRPPGELARDIAGATAAVGLEGLGARAIAELSAGQFQRALFARLIVQEATVILLDEPFAAVDEGTTEDLLRLIARWHAERRTVIAVLHDLDQVRAHFPSTLVLARSCIAWGDTAATLTEDNLARARRTLEPSTGPAARRAA